MMAAMKTDYAFDMDVLYLRVGVTSSECLELKNMLHYSILMSELYGRALVYYCVGTKIQQPVTAFATGQ